MKQAKVERVERARVTDVMEGWGQPGGSQEFERGLRKVAQRGGEFRSPFLCFFSPSHAPLSMLVWHRLAATLILGSALVSISRTNADENSDQAI